MTRNLQFIFPVKHISDFICDDDSFSLRAGTWFDDPPLVRITLHFFTECFVLTRKTAGEGQEVEVTDAVQLLHALDPTHQEVFAGQFEGFGELIYFLVFQKFLVHAGLNYFGAPHYKPIFYVTWFLISYDSKAVLFHDISYQLYIVGAIELIVKPTLKVFFDFFNIVLI